MATPQAAATLPVVPPPAPAFASVNDWCALSGMSRAGTYRLLATGELQARRLHSRTLIDVAHGLAFLRSLPAYRPDRPN